MKIYHKPSFFVALFWFGYAFWTATTYEGHFFLYCALIHALIGMSYLYRAMNKKKAKELIIRDSDEMLLLDHLKCCRAAFWTSCGLLMLTAFVSHYFFDAPASDTVALTTILAVMLMLLTYILIEGIYSFRRR